MKIIGITGHAGSGKTTVAGEIAAQLSARGERVLIESFGYPIKEQAKAEGHDIVRKDDACRKRMQEIGEEMTQPGEISFLHQQIQDAYVGVWRVCLRSTLVVGLINRLYRGLEPGTGMTSWGKSLPTIIIPDVRDKREAMFIEAHGVLVAVEGEGTLKGENVAHVRESMIPDLIKRATITIENKYPCISEFENLWCRTALIGEVSEKIFCE